MKNNFHFPALYACAAVLVLSGCAAKSADNSALDSSKEKPQLVKVAGVYAVQMPADSVKLAGITVVPVSSGTLSTQVQPTGQVSATDSGTVQITSRLPGKIVATYVNAGDRVKKGQVLAEVDSVDLAQSEATYQTALAHANLAKSQLEQQKKLAGYGSLSEQPLEDAHRAAVASDAAVGSDEQQIKVDKLALQSTRQLLDMGEITRKPLEDAQNAFAQAQSASVQAGVTLHSAKANYDRAKILFNGGIYSKQQLEDAETAYNTAVAAAGQTATAEKLAKQEETRQQTIFDRNLNGATSLQGAQAKLQQDEHTYQNDLVAQALSHKEFQRAQAVHKSGIPMSQALQSAQDAYDEAQVAVQGAANTIRLYGVQPESTALQLHNGRAVVPLVSPIDGVVASRSMAAGQNTDTSTILAKVENLDRVYVDAQVYEKDLARLSVGDPVDIQVSAAPSHAFSGHVQWIASEVSPDTRTVTVRTVLENPGWILRPGMFASVSIGSQHRIAGVAIPADAVLQEGDKQVAYVQVAPNQFVKRTLKVGPEVGGQVPVTSGLLPGDMVVEAGNVLIEKEQESLEGGKSGS